MTNEEMTLLVEKYFNKEGYVFPGHYEHRFDQDSSAMMYSIIREYKPKKFLEIGSWLGGSSSLIMAALLKNDQRFTFISSEIDDHMRNETEKNVRETTGSFPIMIGDITKNIDKVPELDFLFVDTNHDLDTTKWIIKNIWSKLKKGGIFCMHDWPVREENGDLKTKEGQLWPETEYLMNMIKTGEFPFKKLFWTYGNPGQQETGFWICR